MKTSAPATKRRRQLSSRSRKAWSGLEDTLLRQLISDGQRAANIAILLARTTRAVRSRSEVLGISWKDLRRPRKRVHFILPKHSETRSRFRLAFASAPDNAACRSVMKRRMASPQ